MNTIRFAVTVLGAIIAFQAAAQPALKPADPGACMAQASKEYSEAGAALQAAQASGSIDAAESAKIVAMANEVNGKVRAWSALAPAARPAGCDAIRRDLANLRAYITQAAALSPQDRAYAQCVSAVNREITEAVGAMQAALGKGTLDAGEGAKAAGTMQDISKKMQAAGRNPAACEAVRKDIAALKTYLASAAAAGFKLVVHNYCREARSFAVKNDQNGQYQVLAVDKTDTEMFPGERREFVLLGPVFYAHWSGRVDQGVKITGPGELVMKPEGTGCVLAFGNTAQIVAGLTPVTNLTLLKVENSCADRQSVAIKNDDNQVYQLLGGATDIAVNRGESKQLPIFGRKFYAHWSGRVDIGVKWNGAGTLQILPGGTPCRLAFTAAGAVAATEGTFRIAELMATDTKQMAANYMRLVEIYNVPGARATPAEQKQIGDFAAYVKDRRVRAADLALQQYQAWIKRSQKEKMACITNDLKTNPQLYALAPDRDMYTIPAMVSGGKSWCRWNPRPDRMGLLSLIDVGEAVPDDFKNLAISGIPIETAEEGKLTVQQISSIAALGTTAAVGVGAGVAVVATGSATALATAISTTTVGTEIGATVGGMAATAIAAPLAAVAFATAVALPVMFQLIDAANYEPDLNKMLDRYRASTFEMASAMRSEEGRKAVVTYLALHAVQNPLPAGTVAVPGDFHR